MTIRHIDVNTDRAFKASSPNQEVISAQTRIIYDEQQPDTFVKERKMDGTTKTAIGIGAVVLAGLGVLAYVKKGKGKAAEPVKKALKQITDQSRKALPAPAPEPQKAVLSIADFKNIVFISIWYCLLITRILYKFLVDVEFSCTDGGNYPVV